MGLPSTPTALASILRLNGLKNARGRKVMEDNNVLNDLNNIETNIEGVAAPAPPPPNVPEADLGGELNSQQYDVRANTAMTPGVGNYMHAGTQPVEETPSMEEEKPNVFHRLGQALSDYVNPEKRREMTEGNEKLFNRNPLPQVSGDYMHAGTQPVREDIRHPPMDLMSIPPVVRSLFGLSGNLLPETLGDVEKKKEWNAYHEDEGIRAQGKNPVIAREEKQRQLAEDVDKAMLNPGDFSAYGAAEQVEIDPELRQNFEEITGIDYEPQIAAQISTYEGAMKGVEDSLNGIQTSLSEQENQIKDRILNNQSTDADMYYIGLALLMPLIIGGFFGKEAGLGALAGGAQGVAEAIGRRGKGIQEDEATLLNIARQKSENEERLGKLGLERSQLRPNLLKNLPEDPRAHLLGMEGKQWTNPETGKTENIVEILPGLVANESFVKTKEGLASRRKAADDLSDKKNYVDQLDDITNDVIKITSQLKDQSIVPQIFKSYFSGVAPGSLSQTSQDVEFDGRKVNAGILLDEKLGFLASAYAQAQKLGQLDRAAQSHIAKIINNPETTLASPRDVIDQMLQIRKLAQAGLIYDAKNKGFIPEFLKQHYAEKNNEVFSGLNKKERAGRAEEVLQKTARTGTSYAQ